MFYKILIACERSSILTNEFRRLGFDAFSCDIKPSYTNKHYHFKCDVDKVLGLSWDLVIAFPPCTDLSVSGARWFKYKDQKPAISFFMKFTKLNHVKRVAIENPIGIMSSVYRKPDQIIQPWWFGDSYQKSTCLWLKNLPHLKSTNFVDPGEFVTYNGKTLPKWYSSRTRERDITFAGVAKAMALQWGNALLCGWRKTNTFFC